MGVIYKTTNLITGKIYIGKRIFNTNKFLNTKYYGSGKLIKQSINKYGLENFIREIIEEVDNNILGEREIFWIKYYNSNNLGIGYNISIGGNGKFGKKGYKISDDTKQKLREYTINQWKTNIHPFKNKKHKKESIEKMSLIKLGKKASKETVEKMIKNRIGMKYNKKPKPIKIKIDQSKKIIQKTLNNEFIKTWNSIAEASKYYGFDRGGISKACSGKFKQSNGYKWEFL